MQKFTILQAMKQHGRTAKLNETTWSHGNVTDLSVSVVSTIVDAPYVCRIRRLTRILANYAQFFMRKVVMESEIHGWVWAILQLIR